MKRITLTAALLLASPAALACNTLEHQVGWLAREFGERPMIRAASTDGHVLVLFGNPETPEQLQDMFADELADAFIYLDLTAQAAGIDLPSAVRQKFDRTSQKIGYRS